MFRRVVARVSLVVAVLLIAAACTSTTVIGEGRLGSETATSNDTTAGETDLSAETVGGVEADDATTDRGERAGAEAIDDEPEPPVSLADDELIRAWSQECRDGSDLACDVLFTLTERGSDAELLAQTCGGRSDVDVRFCTPDIEPFEDRLWFDAASPGLPDVVADCEAGDLISCDFLYFRSEVGSNYEEIGTTCGGQVAIAAPDCRSALGDG